MTLFERLQHIFFLSSHILAFRGLVADLSWPASVSLAESVLQDPCLSGAHELPLCFTSLKESNEVGGNSHLYIHKRPLTPMKQLWEK